MKFQGKTIRKTKSNTWYTRYRFRGKQYYICAKSQKGCYEKLKKALREVNTMQLSVPAIETKENSITLAEWYEQWLELYKIGQVKEGTIKDYQKSLVNVPQEIMNTRLRDIKSIDILRMLNSIKAERQRQKVYELLLMIFDKAMKNDFIDKNVIANIDKPKHEKINSQPLTVKQEEKFIEVCKFADYGDYFLICLYQGLRKGECLGITDQDIDFKKKTLTINKSINGNNRVDTTKNKQSIRTIPIFDRAYDVLKKYDNVKGRIFGFSPKTQRVALDKINKLLNFHVKTKDLRSTFITRCQENNIPEFVIQSWVGHRIGSKVTSSVYTKYNEQDNTKYINILNKSKNYSKTTHEKK